MRNNLSLTKNEDEDVIFLNFWDAMRGHDLILSVESNGNVMLHDYHDGSTVAPPDLYVILNKFYERITEEDE